MLANNTTPGMIHVIGKHRSLHRKLLLLLAVFFLSSSSQGQTGTFAAAPGTQNMAVFACSYSAPSPSGADHTIRAGRTTMIVGGSMMAAGGILMAAGDQSARHGNFGGAFEALGGLLIFSSGLCTALIGGGVYISGKRYEARHSRYSFGVGKNGMGVVYHF